MNTPNDRLVDGLAAHWTDPALEILSAAGVSAVSIDMELATWRTLKRVLRAEVRWQRAFRFSTLVSLGMLMEQVLRKASLLAAEQFAPHVVSAEFESRIRSLVRDRRVTREERRLYAELVRQSALRAAFKPPSQTDCVPRLRVSALG
jgi:hypothetical protein